MPLARRSVSKSRGSTIRSISAIVSRCFFCRSLLARLVRYFRLRRRIKPLGDAVDEQTDDVVFRKIALAEALVFGPQPLGDLAHRRPRQKPARVSWVNVSSTSRVDKPRA